MNRTEIRGVKIVKVISEHKRTCGERVRPGFKRVQAVVHIHGYGNVTRHGDTKDGQFLIMKEFTKK